MSASRRRRNKPKDQRPEVPDEDELDALEPVEDEELETLEPIEDEEPDALEPIEADDDGGAGAVRVTCKAAQNDDFDTEVEVAVADMPKQEVQGEIEVPLRRAVKKHDELLRHRRVVVAFTGEALIGTAVKEWVGGLLEAAKVLRGVVRRGYGDEVVATGKLPEVTVSKRSVGNAVHVDIGGDLEPQDLPVALEPELDKLAQEAAGKRFAFSFTSVVATRAVRDQLGEALAAAGAEAARVGDRILFDRDLERRVTVQADGDAVAVRVVDADDEERTLAALDIALGDADFAGKQVAVTVEGGPAAGVVDRVVALCTQGPPAQVTVDSGTGPDIVWPPLLQVAAKGGRSAIRVRDHGRGRTAVLVAFRREVKAQGEALREQLRDTELTVDWPTGFAIDDEVERTCFAEALVPLGVKSIACSFDGEDREPFVPPPIEVQGQADAQVVTVDTDAGKPPELARAIDRRLRAVASQLRGQKVRVEVEGSGATSRSMMRSLCSIVMGAEANRLEVAEQGEVDVLLPVLLQIGGDGGRVQIAAAAEGRDAQQVDRALQRELDGANLPEAAEIVVAPGPLARQVADAVIARGAARVLIGDEQVHPEVPSPLARDGDQLRIDLTLFEGSPAAAALPELIAGEGDLAAVDVTVSGPDRGEAVWVHELLVQRGARRVLHDDGTSVVQVHPEVQRDYVVVMGRRDDATPPMVLLGVDRGEGDEHVAKVLEKVAAHGELIDGRRVLLVLRDEHGHDRPLRRADAVIDAVRRVVEPRAAATLVFRGLDGQGRSFFQVTSSRVEGLAAGTRVADPRGG